MPAKYSRQERINKFWSRVKITGLLDCWLWQGTRMPFGYGLTGGLNGVTTTAHRVAWAIVYGTVPEGMFVLHKCDNPPCVNPNHLYAGTQKDNARDAIERGRFTYAVSPCGIDHPGAKLTEADVIQIRRLAEQGCYSQKSIGGWFGISATMVCYIKLRRKWAHI